MSKIKKKKEKQKNKENSIKIGVKFLNRRMKGKRESLTVGATRRRKGRKGEEKTTRESARFGISREMKHDVKRMEKTRRKGIKD